MIRPSVLEICAGAGGQSLGLEKAGFEHVGAVDNDADACKTLRLNRPSWHVLESDVAAIHGREFEGIDLLAGGVPCPPFSIAGKQLGQSDERDMFPQALRLAKATRPRAILIENVRGLAAKKFSSYRTALTNTLKDMGYVPFWRLLNASDYGVPQLRPRFILVALRPEFAERFEWPRPDSDSLTVGETIVDLMSAAGWPGAGRWAKKANRIAPTIVGGSKKHGGPDLGPTRARLEWQALGVDGRGIANEAPSAATDPDHVPRLTTRMVARIQGFEDSWFFSGGKTAAYRQVGNAFPPPVAAAIARSILEALSPSSNGHTALTTRQSRLRLATTSAR